MLANAAPEAARKVRPAQTATPVHQTPLAHDQEPPTSLSVEAVSQALVDCTASHAALAHSHQVGELLVMSRAPCSQVSHVARTGTIQPLVASIQAVYTCSLMRLLLHFIVSQSSSC